MRRAAKKDDNHNEIVQYLEKAGCLVLDLSRVGEGCPDLFIGYRGRLYLVEIKDGNKPPSARVLTSAQEKFHEKWKDYPLFIFKNDEDIKNFLRIYG